MSFSAMAWATKQKVPATQKLVLLMLASMADNDKGICWPKHSTLAEDCSLSDRSVRDQLKGLESAGLIEIIHRSIEGVSLSNCYRLNRAGVGQQVPGGMAAGSGGVWQQLPGVGQQVPTDTVIETIIPKQSDKQSPPQAAPVAAAPKRSKKLADPMIQPPPSIDAETWKAFYEHRLGHKVGPMTEHAQRLMLKRLESFKNPKAAMETAITGGYSDCKEWTSANRPQFKNRHIDDTPVQGLRDGKDYGEKF